jgi:hypothetical protein
MINGRVRRLSAWVALVLVLVAVLPASPSFAQAGNSPTQPPAWNRSLTVWRLAT